VIKYWGKRDEDLILPINSSLSGTLNQADMKTTTTIVASKRFSEDRIWLNGKEESISNKRLQCVLKEVRRRSTATKEITKEELSQYKVHIVSVNNFPTAAGLASSASGYCCLVFALAQIYNVTGDVSTIARMGSGSACRSLYGGWVSWDMGSLPDGSDSKARQVATESHWDEMRVLVLVVNDKKKETSSTAGMQQSVETSKLIKNRAENVVPVRMQEMESAILKRDFQIFAKLTMDDSDDFHAVFADTNPAIFYMNETSRNVVQLVHNYNEHVGKLSASYTFDAGPNPVIYLLKEHVVPVLALIRHHFPSDTPEDSYICNVQDMAAVKSFVLPEELSNQAKEENRNALKYIFQTSVGPGPQVLASTPTLLVNEDGLPL